MLSNGFNRGSVGPTLVLVVALLACADSRRRSSDDRNADPPQSAAPEPPTSGNYFGIVHDSDADQGEYLRLNGSSSAFYDGIRWIRICELTQNDREMAFRTAPLFGRVFAFRGSAGANEFRGPLTGFARSREVGFRRLDDDASNSATRTRVGFYSDLRYVEETGDNVGAELFVGAIAGERTVALMIAEGSAGSPLIGFNQVEAADTLRFDLWRAKEAPRATAVFQDSIVLVSLTNEVGPPRRLRKEFSLQGFYDQAPTGECGH